MTTWSDEKEFADCHEALFKLGFSEQQRGEMYTMLALCLNLGNLTFKPGKEGSEIPDQKLLKKCAAAPSLALARPDVLLCARMQSPRIS